METAIKVTEDAAQKLKEVRCLALVEADIPFVEAVLVWFRCDSTCDHIVASIHKRLRHRFAVQIPCTPSPGNPFAFRASPAQAHPPAGTCFARSSQRSSRHLGQLRGRGVFSIHVSGCVATCTGRTRPNIVSACLFPLPLQHHSLSLQSNRISFISNLFCNLSRLSNGRYF